MCLIRENAIPNDLSLAKLGAFKLHSAGYQLDCGCLVKGLDLSACGAELQDNAYIGNYGADPIQ